ncbi:MAG: hypothetical protein WCL32_19465 [Planctomycetota bacterium]
MLNCSRVLAVLTIALSLGLAFGQEPAKGRTWKESTEPAEVIAATFLGGKGNEWLAAGGFQPDGSVVLAGNVLGGTLELSVPAKVIGNDRPVPGAYKPIPIMEKKEQKVDKAGKPLFERPSWRHDGATGFIVRTSGDLKKTLSVHRLPWASGVITAVEIGPDGSIYIAGRATDGIASITSDNVEELKVRGNSGRKDAPCNHTFVARLSPDASKVVWAKQAKGPSTSPRLDWNAEGKLRFIAQEVYTLGQDGSLIAAIEVPGGVRTTASVNPKDGSIVVGGEHHSSTGREPWRCPVLNLHNPDGTLKYQFYDWSGPFVGIDTLRQVSDTAVRWVTHDKDGSILIYAWSDGGNSVMTTQPADIRKPVGHKGLGITAAGAGVLSAAYVVRIDPKDFNVTGWTIWLAFSDKGKPNSIWIDTLASADDQSILMGGRGAWGIVQTKNKISEGEPTGPYIAVLNPDMSSARFCSTIPGACVVDVAEGAANRPTGWGIARGVVGGKQRALFLTGIAPPTDTSEGAIPTRNATQAAFGGGESDGYVVLVEFDKAAPPKASVIDDPKDPKQPTRAAFERSAGGKSTKPATQPEDAIYNLKSDIPKWITVDAEFRDRGEKHWPSFIIGRPESGTLTTKDGKLSGSFTLLANRPIQNQGDQSRRVLGELIKDGKSPDFRLTIDSIEPTVKTFDRTSTDSKGKAQIQTVEYVEAKGTIEFGGKKIPVTPKLTYNFGKTSGVYSAPGKISPATDSIRGAAWLTLPARDLGLSLGGDIDIRIGFSAVAANKTP